MIMEHSFLRIHVRRVVVKLGQGFDDDNGDEYNNKSNNQTVDKQ